MSFSIKYTKKAFIDLEKICSWYEEKKENLGEEFINEVFAIETILVKDEVNIEYQIVYKEDISRIRLKRFPYVVYFRKNEKQKIIIILAVLYKGRDIETVKKHLSS